ncbi:MAG: hypothetical protein GTO12_07100 [Proteobacteria bacterium]|nr:hypothetical protein [Pseudomonadota bacterium]
MIFFNQILPELYVGTYPENSKDIRKLSTFCGVTAVLNLQTNEDLREKGLDWLSLEGTYGEFSVEIQRVPMRDFDYEDQRRVLPDAVRTLAKLLTSGHTVYLHCNAGVGRSPLVAMAYLYWYRGLGLSEAIRYVQLRRPCSPYEDLLEVGRQDLLQNEGIQEQISRLAYEISQQPMNDPVDPQIYREEAERKILKRFLDVEK